MAPSAESSAVSAIDPRSPFAASPAGQRPISVHLVGAGHVGQAFLRRLAGTGLRLAAVSDSRSTEFHPEGLDAQLVAQKKALGLPLVTPRSGKTPALDLDSRVLTELLLDLIHADIVVDCTSSDSNGTAAALARARVARRCGATLVFASKAAPAHELARWLADDAVNGGAGESNAADSCVGINAADSCVGSNAVDSCVGINAACGGAGRAMLADSTLRSGLADSIAVVGNASTTELIAHIEAGASWEQAKERVTAAGLFEPDPRDDLTGRDTALKLCIAAQVAGIDVPAPAEVILADDTALDCALLRARAAAGFTTRLIGRADRSGKLEIRYEELPRTSPLAIPGDRVAYAFTLRDGRLRLHLGSCLGYEGTASAVLEDVLAIAAAKGARS